MISFYHTSHHTSSTPINHTSITSITSIQYNTIQSKTQYRMMIDLPYLYIKLTASGIQFSISNPQLNELVRKILLADSKNADYYLAFLLLSLICLCFKQLHAFSRPPPVQRKLLPRRPTLQILFKPDDVSTAQQQHNQQQQQQQQHHHQTPDDLDFYQDHDDDYHDPGIPDVVGQDHDSTTSSSYTPATEQSQPKTKPIIHPQDLPDGFAPLLSSSQMEILYEELTTDLLHATHVEGSIRLRHGRHEIPLDKDSSRPQLILDIGKEGCKVTVVAAVGSDGFSNEDDLNPLKGTTERSLPMVKHAGVTLDPPLRLANVAPTLIHFPTLFEDNVVKYTLRRIQIVRYGLDMLKSISSFIEKVLWICESKCQIHLGKVSVTPLYKGAEKVGNDGVYGEPQWRLSLAFSGHAVLFGCLPIPFVNVTLPTWIIPQPHALLQYLVSSQPLASARLKRREIAEQRITLALIDVVDTWDLKVEAVATPPALSVDVALPGGITMAVEAMHGSDMSGGKVRGGVESSGYGMAESNSFDTMSTCTYTENDAGRARFRRHRTPALSSHQNSSLFEFDINNLVPWKFNLALKGKVDSNQISVVCSNLSASHDPSVAQGDPSRYNELAGSKISLSGNVVICKPDAAAYEKADQHSSFSRKASATQLQNLALEAERRHIAAIILFPEKRSPSATMYSNQRHQNLLKYDYNFDIGEDTSLDAVSLSIGASHPMLKGGTIISTILESIYSYGSISAREDSIVDMGELRRKRNILMHLPAVDVTAGIQNIFIPEESMSFSDDGQTKCIPELLGGQMMIRVMGGFEEDPSEFSRTDGSSSATASLGGKRVNMSRHDSGSSLHVAEGIKVILDFGVGAVALKNETNVTQFPELDIFDDQKLISILAGSVDGTIVFHLRPQILDDHTVESLSKNVFNPLEAYEIDFSGSNVGLKISEANATLGHRRLIIPSETTVGVSIVNSVVDMAFDGTTECELNWDFQGASPILQSTTVGLDPQLASHEEKEQVNLLIYSLRQGRFNLNVSSVGGLTITEASTSREDKEGKIRCAGLHFSRALSY